jgi:hypothetical protein
LLEQKGGNEPVDARLYRREQLGMGGAEGTQRNRKRQHPLAHRHSRDDVVDPAGDGFCHAPGATRGAKPTLFAGASDRFLMGTVGAAVSEIRQQPGKRQRFSVGILYTPPFDRARIVFQAFDS